MKNAKKIGLAILLVAVLAVGVVIAVFANTVNYTGTVEKLTSLVQTAADADEIDAKEKALTEVEKYLTSKPVDPESEGYADAMEAYKAAKIGMIELYSAAVESGEISLYKTRNYCKESDKWFKSIYKTEEDKADGQYETVFATIHDTNVLAAGKLFDAVDQAALKLTKTTTATAEADGAYKAFKTFAANRIFDTESGDFATIKANAEALTLVYTEAVAKRYYNITSEARMTDYTAKTAYNNDFEGAKTLPTMSNDKGYNPVDGSALNNTRSQVKQTLPDGTTNTYLAIDINGAMNKGLTGYVSTYCTISFNGTVDKFVMEFDFTSFTELPNSGVLFQCRPSDGSVTWFEIDYNGDILAKDGKILVKNAVVPGEWTHFSIVCEVDNIKQSTLYLDYSYAATINGDPSSYGYAPEQFRIGNLGNSRGQYCMDNVTVKYAASIVDPNFLNRMTDAEKFVYLCDYMQRTGDDEEFITVPDCIDAHKQATDLVSGIGAPDADGNMIYGGAITEETDPVKKQALIDAVHSYYEYDPTDIILTYKRSNLAKYKEMIEQLKAIQKLPTSASISNRNKLVSTITSFVSSYSAYIFLPTDDHLPIEKGSGTLADPYILTHGANEVPAAAGWVYFKYNAPTVGKIKFAVSGTDVILGYGATLEGVDAVGESFVEKTISAVGEEHIFAVKIADGATIEGNIAINVSFDLGYTYDDLVNDFSSEETRIAQDTAISNFIAAMDGFKLATSATLLQSRYDMAAKLIADGLNTSLASLEGYEKFKTHLEETYVEAPEKIALAISDNNAKLLINYIGYLMTQYPTESDWKLVYVDEPTTPEQIANNEQYKHIESYVKMIRNKISGGAYNPDYIAPDGTTVVMAANKFEEMNEYYYGILQNEHIEVISEQFDKFVATDSYIEKKGIISFIQRYFNAEDVDFTVEFTCANEKCANCGVLYNGKVDDIAHPACNKCGEAVESYRLVSGRAEISAVLKKYTAYEAELAPQEGNYEDLLNQNTVYFVNAVKKFDTAITYVEKLELLNAAMPYYYAMNISNDEVREAIAKYDALAAELAVVQNDSAAFIENVLSLAAIEEKDDYYRMIVAAASLRSGIDASIEGIPEAIVTYEAALAEYNAHIDTANTEIAESGYTLGSFGANSGIAAVLSVILKALFSFK